MTATVALKLVDWEENPGLGSEANPKTNFHAGDDGITIDVKNAAGESVVISDESRRAQTFYTGPLKRARADYPRIFNNSYRID